jgi:hypothetical protein
VIAFVLDYLKDGPASLDDLCREAWSQFAYPRAQVISACKFLCLHGEKLDGIPYVHRPHNLVAIWWAKRHCTWKGRRHEGDESNFNLGV